MKENIKSTTKDITVKPKQTIHQKKIYIIEFGLNMFVKCTAGHKHLMLFDTNLRLQVLQFVWSCGYRRIK